MSDTIGSRYIWFGGADRYRYPAGYLPKDVDARREAYYTGLNLTADASAFSSAIREELAQELLLINANIPRHDKVRLLWRGENRISLHPFNPLPEPRGLASIQTEISPRRPMNGLHAVLTQGALAKGLPEPES